MKDVEFILYVICMFVFVSVQGVRSLAATLALQSHHVARGQPGAHDAGDVRDLQRPLPPVMIGGNPCVAPLNPVVFARQ